MTSTSMIAAREAVDAELNENRPALNGRECVSAVAHSADSADSGTNDESAEHDGLSAWTLGRALRDRRLPLGPRAPKAVLHSVGPANGYSYRHAADVIELPTLYREPYERRIVDGAHVVESREIDRHITALLVQREVA